jgi:hypothetical protein
MKQPNVGLLLLLAWCGACQSEPDEMTPDAGETPSGVAGHWHVERTQIAGASCSFDGRNAYDIEIRAVDEGFEVVRDGFDPVPLAMDPTDPGRLSFTFAENWGTTREGTPLDPRVRHELQRDGDLLRGEATTGLHVESGSGEDGRGPGGECDRTWRVDATPADCHDCVAGPAPIWPVPSRVTEGHAAATILRVGGQRFWASPTTVYRVEQDGTSTAIYESDTFVNDLIEAPGGLAFWTPYPADSVTSGAVRRLAADGSSTLLPYQAPLGGAIVDLAVDGDDILIASLGGVDALHPDGSVTPILGGETYVTAFWIRRIGDQLWIGDGWGNRIGRISDDRATIETVVSGIGYVPDFTATTDYVLFSNDGTLERRPIDGGPGITLATDERELRAFALIGDQVYWAAELADHTLLRRVSVGGGPAKTIYQTPSPWIHALTADSGTLVWAESGLQVLSLAP